MDLKSGQLYWLTGSDQPPHYPVLERDVVCEVAVVGGGITGALAAYYLAEAGIEVVLVDKRSVARGSTSATTALLLPELDTHLGRLIDLVGEKHAVRSYRLGVRAIDAIETLTRTLGDPCGFERKPSLYLASSERDADELAREWKLRRKHGIDVELLGRADLEACYSFRRPAALRSRAGAQVDPFRLTLRLIERAWQHGLRVYEHTAVIGYEPQAGGITLLTGGGPKVRARRVVFATGYESQQHLRQATVQLTSTYAVASEPIERFPGWQDRCLIWETARPYLYLRTTADNRVLIGGADEEFQDPGRRDALLPEKCRFLREQFREMFPEIRFEAAYTWAGTFGGTRDGLPYIGEAPDFPGACFALGYGGNGMTFGMIAAEILRDRYLGRVNPDAEIFRFGR